MILIIGGANSGKGDYAKTLGFPESEIAFNIHELVFQNPDFAPGLLESFLKNSVVTCDEVGSGVIPANRHERAAREATGRLCVLLAQKAERVVRMVAGIPITIKNCKL
ncbi:MAG: bifunctional adenosylcobinamide kinase/adenosylcobinamide-phosphate guanylyltransferase [Oscillospiraceae bacterium]|jgi:adenosyl cobinamide kinase/adenosyl cobinamide phosphate guanylyltransferase|nr:bifunctional adenosylcobinamide kinase/adenosylcobinamide-phosphate guanylyltransferase [Oscillospiraceae bacterium]